MSIIDSIILMDKKFREERKEKVEARIKEAREHKERYDEKQAQQ